VVSTRLLLVDDNESFLEAARELLENEGLDVVGVAVDADEALFAAGEHHPELALVDVDLGTDSGVRLAGELAVAHPWLEVILISAYSAEDLPELLDESPALGFIHKSRLSRRAIEELIGARQ
jgi:DNA-binding NarL/FixJ family response regulator